MVYDQNFYCLARARIAQGLSAAGCEGGSLCLRARIEERSAATRGEWDGCSSLSILAESRNYVANAPNWREGVVFVGE